MVKFRRLVQYVEQIGYGREVEVKTVEVSSFDGFVNTTDYVAVLYSQRYSAADGGWWRVGREVRLAPGEAYTRQSD